MTPEAKARLLIDQKLESAGWVDDLTVVLIDSKRIDAPSVSLSCHHKAEFQLLVMGRIGQESAEKIDWRGTRLLEAS